MAARYLVIENISMDGTEQTYTVPANVSSIAFQAIGGDVEMRHVTGTVNWTIGAGTKEGLDMRTVANEEFIFYGLTGTTLQIRRFTGLLS